MKKKNTIFTKNISFLCLSGLFIIFPIAMYQNTSINEEKTIPRLETITGRIIDFDLGDFSSGITIDTTGDGKANSLYMWGNNQVGQLGLGDNTNYNTPMIVTDLPEGGIIDFSLGETQSGATIDTTGDGKADSLYMWGDNEDGQLGLGSEKTEASYNTPQEVTTLPEGELIDLSFGSNDSGVTIDTTGDGVADTLYMWGYNEYGQLGLGNFVNYDTPQEVTDLPQGGIIDFDLGYHHVGTIIDTTGDGTADSIYMWGANLTGQIGDGTDESSPTPIEIIINSGGSIVDFELGGYDTGVTFDTTADGKADTIYVWGGNFWGELGLGDDQWVFPIPTELNTLPEGEIIDFELGLTHSGAIIDTTGDGVGDALYMWGDNEYGQLGLGSEKPLGWYNSPQNVDLTGIGTPDDLRLGYADSGLTVDTISDGNSDAIYMWGLNEYGELGLGNYSSYGTPQNTEFLIEPPLPLPPSSQDTAIVSDIDTTSATINYSFYPGNDETGNPYEVTDITLSGTGITNNYTVETSSSSVGTITLQDLDPATNYNDLIVHATFNDGNTYEQTVDIFTTRITITAPHPNDIAVVTDIDTTSATINYSFFSGNDETGNPYEVTNI
ncbi:MAG: hypothetical protein GQ557_00020, partial [Mycoplasmataceae bacterium]|nr:hypothetical protein [Mycoplasmataceae bacterium]